MSPSLLIDALIRASVQGTVAIVAVWALLAVWRKCPHSVRCWLWRIALVKMLIGLVVLNPFTFKVLPAKSRPVHNITTTAPAPMQGYASVEMGETVEINPRDAGDSAAIPDLPPPPVKLTIQDAIAWIWWIGAGIVFGLTLVSVLVSKIKRSQFRPAADEKLLNELHSICELAGLRRVPDLLVSADSGPMVIGLIRPAIVLPESYFSSEKFDDGRLILAHEIAHITRHDLAWELLPTAARILFFFNPFVYAGRDQSNLAREMACDAAALRLTGASNAQYARMLVECVASGRANVMSIGMAEAYGAIRSRIFSVANPIRVSHIRMASIAVLMVIAGIALLVPWSLAQKMSAAAQPEVKVKDTYAGLYLIPGEYKLKWEFRDPDYNQSPQYYPLESLSPELRRRIVGKVSKRALTGDFGGFVEIIDDSRGKGYDVAYVFPPSWTGKGKVIDLKKAWKAPLRREGDMLINESFKVKATLGKGSEATKQTVEMSMIIRLTSPRYKLPDMNFVHRGGWYGVVKTSKGDLEVQTEDSTGDGLFDSPKSPGYWCSSCGEYHEGESDHIQMHDIRSSSGMSSNYSEGECPSTGTGVFAGKVYTIQTSSNGQTVSIHPYTGPKGTLLIHAVDGFGKAAGFSASIRSYKSKLEVNGVASGFGSRAIELPPGTYNIDAIVGVPDADDGFQQVEFGKLPRVTIKNGTCTRVDTGGKVNLQILPKGRPVIAYRGKRSLVALTAVNEDGTTTYITSLPEEAISMAVLDAKGRTVDDIAISPVELGTVPSIMHFDASKLKPGTYTVKASCDFSPYSPKSTVSAQLIVKE